jgi:hypothetical protein
MGSNSQEVQQRARLQKERIEALLALARMGRKLLKALVTTAKIDAEALARVELSR